MVINPGNANTDNLNVTTARANLSTSTDNAYVTISNKDKDLSQRMRRTTFQNRLARKLDNIGRKVIDNNIRLNSGATDVLKISVKRDERSGDLISRRVDSAEIIPIVMPILKDIPIRYLMRDTLETVVSSLYTIEEQQYFEIYSPVACNLGLDDLLVYFVEDPNMTSQFYVTVFQVKEILGSFGINSMKMKKFWITLYDEKLPQELVNMIKQAMIKRNVLGW